MLKASLLGLERERLNRPLTTRFGASRARGRAGFVDSGFDSLFDLSSLSRYDSTT